MGLFDRFKKKDKVSEKPNPTSKVVKHSNSFSKGEKKRKVKKEVITRRNEDGKLIFITKIGSKEFKSTKKEAEEGARKIKKEYRDKLKSKVKVMGQDINIDLSNELDQTLNDAIIENYGTEKEIAELRERQRKKDIKKQNNEIIREKKEKAHNFRVNGEYLEAIKVYREIINDLGDSDSSLHYYFDIEYCYEDNGDYDKAIEVCNEEIAILKRKGKDYSKVESRKKDFEQKELSYKISAKLSKAKGYYYSFRFDEASDILYECIELGSDRPLNFELLSNIHIRKKELESAVNVLTIGIERVKNSKLHNHESNLHNNRNTGLIDILENVNHKIETGKFKWDVIPFESEEISKEIKDAKTILKDEDKEKGVELLEEIMANGTYNNTVYYTLYQTYKKDGKYDDAIRVCNKAIESLGYFSNDRYEKWNNYLEKVIVQKEKKEKKK